MVIKNTPVTVYRDHLSFALLPKCIFAEKPSMHRSTWRYKRQFFLKPKIERLSVYKKPLPGECKTAKDKWDHLFDPKNQLTYAYTILWLWFSISVHRTSKLLALTDGDTSVPTPCAVRRTHLRPLTIRAGSKQ